LTRRLANRYRHAAQLRRVTCHAEEALNPKRRDVLRAGVAGTLAAGLPSALLAQGAQGYPDRPIRLIVPFQAGGAVDATARIVGERLAENLGQPVIVENRVGAGGTIGTGMAAKAPADGYTLLFGVLGPMGLAPSLYAKLSYDPVADFAPVAQIAFYPNTLMISRSAPFKSVRELIAAARAKPETITYATGGSGTILHLSAELFSKQAGIKMVHVPYKGGLAAMPDVSAGRVPVLFANIGLSLPYLHSDKIAVLAVTGRGPAPLLPGVPTLAEAADIPGYETYDWFGVLAPAGTPEPLVTRLHDEIARALRAPPVAKKLAAQGAEVVSQSPQDFGRLIRSEISKWAEVIKFSGARLD
jgi:tripartite-type tricarboxylate transporter receptor subunit TctC